MKFFLCLMLLVSTTGFYTLTLPLSNGSTVNLSQFRGKKVLLVNIASRSNGMSQLPDLSLLQQQFSRDLVVILIPSNSFGKEPLSNSQILQSLNTVYGTQFVVAAKSPVAGPAAIGVYKWLVSEAQNGVGAVQINENFQKVLISDKGEIVGIFSGVVKPLSQTMLNAVKAAY